MEVDEVHHRAQAHADFGPDRFDLATAYLSVLLHFMEQKQAKGSKILIECTKETSPAWFDALRSALPMVRLVLIQSDEAEHISEFHLLELESDREGAPWVPIVFVAEDDAASALYHSIVFDTIIVDDPDRLEGSRKRESSRKNAFHLIGVGQAPRGGSSSSALFSSFFDNQDMTGEQAGLVSEAGGSLRVSFAFVDLIAEAADYAKAAAVLDQGFDLSLKAKDLRDIIYQENGEALCTLFSAVGKLAIELLHRSTQPNSRVLVCCSKSSDAEALVCGFEPLLNRSYGTGSVLYLNGATAGTNFCALERASNQVKVVVARFRYAQKAVRSSAPFLMLVRRSVAERQMSNLWKHVDSAIFVDCITTPHVLANLFNGRQTKQCLALIVEAANGYGAHQAERAAQTFQGDGRPLQNIKPEYSAPFKAARLSIRSIGTDASAGVVARVPPRSVLQAAIQDLGIVSAVKAEPAAASSSSSTFASQATVSSSQTSAPAHSHQNEVIIQLTDGHTQEFAAFGVQFRGKLHEEDAKRQERVANRKKRPPPGELGNTPKRAKRPLSIYPERFKREHMEQYNMTSAKVKNSFDSEHRKMMLLISISSEYAKIGSVKSANAANWLLNLLKEVSVECDYEILESAARDNRGSKMLVFAVLLLPRSPLTTRESWLLSTKGRFAQLDEDKIIQLVQLFDIEIEEDEISEISVEFVSYQDESEVGADVDWDDVEFNEDLSTPTGASSNPNRSFSSRVVSPSKRSRGRRTSLGRAGDDDYDMLMEDDLSGEGSRSPVRRAKAASTSSSHNPHSAGAEISFNSSDAEPNPPFLQRLVGKLAAAAAPVPPPAVILPIANPSAPPEPSAAVANPPATTVTPAFKEDKSAEAAPSPSDGILGTFSPTSRCQVLTDFQAGCNMFLRLQLCGLGSQSFFKRQSQSGSWFKLPGLYWLSLLSMLTEPLS